MKNTIFKLFTVKIYYWRKLADKMFLLRFFWNVIDLICGNKK